VKSKRDKICYVKYWEIIADNLSKAGWSLGWVAALDCEGRTIWIADAHRGDGKHFVVHAEEKLIPRPWGVFCPILGKVYAIKPVFPMPQNLST
jgi:hypothetical protein